MKHLLVTFSFLILPGLAHAEIKDVSACGKHQKVGTFGHQFVVTSEREDIDPGTYELTSILGGVNDQMAARMVNRMEDGRDYCLQASIDSDHPTQLFVKNFE